MREKMNFKEIENIMKNDIEKIFNEILEDSNYILPISSKSRSGAEISDYLEDAFVAYFNNKNHPRIDNPISAPKGHTKSPYDFCFIYEYNGFSDLIWADIKAINCSYDDSNPDLGTPEKLIKFIIDGHFYIMFVLVLYMPTNDNKTLFCPFNNNKYVKCEFLKDIDDSVRINPKPQFQVNINKPFEYRENKEFIDLFYKKYQESIDRNIQKQLNKKSKLDERFNLIYKKLDEYKNK